MADKYTKLKKLGTDSLMEEFSSISDNESEPDTDEECYAKSFKMSRTSDLSLPVDISREKVIEDVYQSMSKIISVLTSDNHLLNKRLEQGGEKITVLESVISDIHQQLTLVQDSVFEIKENINELEITESTDKITDSSRRIAEVQKQLISLRTWLMDTISKQSKSIKNISNEKYLQNIIAKEVKKQLLYHNILPTKEAPRKSMIRKVNSLRNDTGHLLTNIQEQIRNIDYTEDVKEIKRKQSTFMKDVEEALGSIRQKIDKLQKHQPNYA